MIDVKQLLQTIPEEELKKIEKALLDGADATQPIERCPACITRNSTMW